MIATGETDAWITSQLMTLLVAAQETTRSMLHFAVFYLAKYPEYQEAFRKSYLEGDDHMVSAVLKETLRLQPPVPYTPRLVEREFNAGGYRFPKGSVVYISQLVSHHSPKVWGDDVREFNPDRFLGEEPVLGCYLPFGVGPRMCIGWALALEEGRVFLGELIRSWKIFVPEGAEAEPGFPDGFLKMVNELPLSFSKREGTD